MDSVSSSIGLQYNVVSNIHSTNDPLTAPSTPQEVTIRFEKGIPVKSELVIQLAGDVHSPQLGYPVIQQLLARQAHFTAVVAFNDMSAIGVIRALQDLKMSVPDDVSVIGFDDIEAAAFTVPRLTTVRQPLAEMGRIAAQCVLNRLHRTQKFRTQITVEPSFVVRESTQAIPQKRARRSAD